MVIFVDTSALYALMDADDNNHEKARNLWARSLQQVDQFATSNYVLVESIALIQHRLGMEATRLFQEELVPILQVHWVDGELHTIAMKVLLGAGRRDLSLVDSTSFEIMRELGLQSVFAFDKHFTEQGFATLAL
jgi:predicted nucleic acid-binding protein